jgi:uncharacterized protein YqeY
MAVMTVIETIRGRITSAMKEKKPEVSILRLALGELQRVNDPNDETCYKIIKKIITNNEETYKLKGQDSLLVENSILKSLLPTELNTEEISHFLLSVIPQIREAKSEGMAIGIAMKILKATGKGVNSGMVASIVKSLRE